MAAPTLAGTATVRHNPASTTATADMPASIAPGELLLAQVTPNTDTPITSDHGYTLIPGAEALAGGKLAVFYKVAGASETACTFTLGSSTASAVALFRVSGALTSGDPSDVTPSTVGSSAGSNSATVPSITTVTPETLLLLFSSINAVEAFAIPSGMSEHYDSGASARTVALHYETRATAGATGTRLSDPTGSGRIMAVMLAIKPAPPGVAMVQHVGMIPLN
jgi:hypothetical protein